MKTGITNLNQLQGVVALLAFGLLAGASGSAAAAVRIEGQVQASGSPHQQLPIVNLPSIQPGVSTRQLGGTALVGATVPLYDGGSRAALLEQARDKVDKAETTRSVSCSSHCARAWVRCVNHVANTEVSPPVAAPSGVARAVVTDASTGNASRQRDRQTVMPSSSPPDCRQSSDSGIAERAAQGVPLRCTIHRDVSHRLACVGPSHAAAGAHA